MADTISKERRSENMRRILSKGTKPEMAVRKLVHALGYRYRLHKKDLPGTPDLVFSPRRKVIFVHGCYWHQHQGCRIGRPPASNTAYWVTKLARNVERDTAAINALTAAGWNVLVIWECETCDSIKMEERLCRFLG